MGSPALLLFYKGINLIILIKIKQDAFVVNNFSLNRVVFNLWLWLAPDTALKPNNIYFLKSLSRESAISSHVTAQKLVFI